ncbi:unnamed protein product [Allacma fusca]|uniref:Uncharacterized protein n=1 Tax=Allacma fusca TaxID=39272 RepID=A0A8J2K3H9_9HEXA|nr:unnamed protein product [Allacma fusca]
MKLFLYFITLFLVAQSHGQTCKEGEVLCEGTKDECILKEYICDGLWLDCSNGWDESDCPCPPGEIKCPNSTMCIPASWICDTDWDCPGGEDEIDCTDCPGFLCADGLCLNARYRCDGELDCSNGEDERDCPPCTGNRLPELCSTQLPSLKKIKMLLL